LSKPTGRRGEADPSSAGMCTAMLSFLWVDLLMAPGPGGERLLPRLARP